jgi:hypothetical protein
MNNTFNINRFGLLLRRQWLEFGKIFLITLGVAFGVIAIFYLVALWPVLAYENDQNISLTFREPLFLIFGSLFISVIASNYFAHLGQKPKTIIDLLIPASTFEKFLAAVCFTAILSVLSFVLIFYVADLAFVSKLRSIYSGKITTTSFQDGVGRIITVADSYPYFFNKLRHGMFGPLYFAPAFITSIFLLGSIYFNKFHYIKTAIAVMLFSGIAVYIVANTAEFLMKNRRPIDANGFIVGRHTNAEVLMVLLILLLTGIFWAITYVRLKEKEV